MVIIHILEDYSFGRQPSTVWNPIYGLKDLNSIASKISKEQDNVNPVPYKMLYPSYSNPIKARLLEDTGHEDFLKLNQDITIPKSGAFPSMVAPCFDRLSFTSRSSFLLGHANLT